MSDFAPVKTGPFGAMSYDETEVPGPREQLDGLMSQITGLAQRFESREYEPPPTFVPPPEPKKPKVARAVEAFLAGFAAMGNPGAVSALQAIQRRKAEAMATATNAYNVARQAWADRRAIADSKMQNAVNAVSMARDGFGLQRDVLGLESDQIKLNELREDAARPDVSGADLGLDGPLAKMMFDAPEAKTLLVNELQSKRLVAAERASATRAQALLNAQIKSAEAKDLNMLLLELQKRRSSGLEAFSATGTARKALMVDGRRAVYAERAQALIANDPTLTPEDARAKAATLGAPTAKEMVAALNKQGAGVDESDLIAPQLSDFVSDDEAALIQQLTSRLGLSSPIDTTPTAQTSGQRSGRNWGQAGIEFSED